jgi:hypothetical protein
MSYFVSRETQHGGMVFYDYIHPIESISVEKCSNNSNLLVFYTVIIIINIYA